MRGIIPFCFYFATLASFSATPVLALDGSSRRRRADPSSADGDGPQTVHLVSLNVTSLETNWTTLHQLSGYRSTAVVALQEARQPLLSIPTCTECAASLDSGAWKASFGPAPDAAWIAGRGRRGGADRVAPAASAQQGGMAVMARLACGVAEPL